MLDFSFLLGPATLGVGQSNLDLMLAGWVNTLRAFAGAMFLALAIGVPLGVIRSLPGGGWASRLVAGYVEIFRNIPLLIQLFLWFFVVPELVPERLGWWLKRDLPQPEYWNLVFALGIFMSARVVELTRAGIGSLGKGQGEAATALGLGMADTYRFVLLPQALRIVMPPLTTEFANCLKASSIGLTVGYIEITQRAREISEQTFRTFEIFAVATLGYFLTIAVIVLLLQVLEHALRIPGTRMGVSQ